MLLLLHTNSPAQLSAGGFRLKVCVRTRLCETEETACAHTFTLDNICVMFAETYADAGVWFGVTLLRMDLLLCLRNITTNVRIYYNVHLQNSSPLGPFKLWCNI